MIEVVAHGAGLSLVVAKERAADRLAPFESRSVYFLACENSMTGQHVNRAELLGGVGTVPSGLGHVIRRQSAGWSYLRG